MSGAQFARLRQDAIMAGYDVTAPDLLGVAGAPPPANYSLEREVDAMVGLLEGLQAPAMVFGHSFGGLVAMEAMMRVPSRFRALVAYEPVAIVLAGREGSEGAKAEVAVVDALMETSIDDGGRSWVEKFIDWWNGPGFFAAMPPAAQAPSVATALEAHRQAGVVKEATITRQGLATIMVPALYLTGVSSPSSARESAQMAAAAMPNGAVEVVDGAGHMGPMTHGKIVNGRILSFFAAH